VVIKMISLRVSTHGGWCGGFISREGAVYESTTPLKKARLGSLPQRGGIAHFILILYCF
jgi:hypothetical protein